MQQQVFDLGLQQQRHRDPALGGGDERAPKADSRKKIRIGDGDVALGGPDCGQVGVFDVAPVPQVVPRDKLASACRRARRDGVGNNARRSNRIAQAAQRPRAAWFVDGGSLPRRTRQKSARGGLVGVFMSSMTLMPPTNHATVDLAELAVAATQTVQGTATAPPLGDTRLDAAFGHVALEGRRRYSFAAVDEHAHAHPARRRAERTTRQATRRVIRKYGVSSRFPARRRRSRA